MQQFATIIARIDRTAFFTRRVNYIHEFFRANKNILASISRLLFRGGPPAVVRFVISVVVDAINRMFARRSRSHISKKILEFEPTITNLNPSRSVVFETLVVRIKAAISQMTPTFEFGCIGAAMRFDMSLNYFRIEAPAALRAPDPQRPSFNNRFVATVTKAEPTAFDSIGVRKRKHKKPAKSLTGKINRFHKSAYIKSSKLGSIIFFIFLFVNPALSQQTIDPRLLPPTVGRNTQVDGVNLQSYDILNFNNAGDIDPANPSSGNIQFDIKPGAVTDSKVAGSGITTRSKLPAAIGYEDEANTWSLTNTYTGSVIIGGSGSFSINGSTSGTITIGRAAAAGTYTFFLPTSAGTSGQPLLSAGGATPMTFGTLGLSAGGTSRSTAWVASRCVRVNDANTALEPAPFDCGGGAGSGGHVIFDQSGAFTQRSRLRFLGTPVTVTDNSGNDSTDVTITAPAINQAGNYTWTGTHSFRDANFSILDDADPTKAIKFQVSGLPTGTTYTYSGPNANTNLLGGSDLGTTVQAYNAKLAAISGLTWSADNIMYATSATAAAQFFASSFSRALMGNNDATQWRSALGLVIGTNVQAFNARLTELSSLTPTTNRLIGSSSTNFIYYTLPGTNCTEAMGWDVTTRTFSCVSFPTGTVSGTTGNVAVFTGAAAVGNGAAYIKYGASGPQLTGVAEFGTPGSDYFQWSTSGLTGKGAVTITAAWRGSSVNLGFTCGTLTNTHLVAINADGCLVDGGAGGAITAASTAEFTNKTIDTKAEGNVFKDVVPISWEAAGCSVDVPGAMMDLPSSGAPTPTCFGTSTTFGTLTFPDGSTSTASRHWKLTSDWDSAVAVTVNLVWFSTSSSTNSVRWCVQTGGKANTESINTGPTYNTATCATTANTGANQRITTTLSPVSMTNVTAGESLWVQVQRLGGDGTDTLAASAELVEVEVLLGVSK